VSLTNLFLYGNIIIEEVKKYNFREFSMKKIFLASIIFSIQVLLPMQNSVPSFDEIEADVLNMLKICNNRCNFMKDVTQNCTSTCFMDYSKQKEYFLIRQYTAQCSDRFFDEEWRFKTDRKDLATDLMKTNRAYAQWGNPGSDLSQCVQKHLGLYNEKVAQLEKRKQRELNKFEKEHPIISGGIKVSNTLRGIKRVEQ